MTLTIAHETPDQPRPRRCWRRRTPSPPRSIRRRVVNGDPLARLLRPEVRFFVARVDGRAIGCGAFVPDADHGAKLKRLFVEPDARGRGVGRAIVDHLCAAAAEAGAKVTRLETGIQTTAALALYRRCGFIDCDRFGDYPPDPLSVWMERVIGRGL